MPVHWQAERRQGNPPRGSGQLVSNDRLAGTWQGNGCCASPACVRLEISAACAGGICVFSYCDGCPIPFDCRYYANCCGKCYTDCDNEGWWTPDENTIDGKCGYGYVRVSGPETVNSIRA
ncbi:MAG: hypothetical protein ACPIOQ_18280 [Promethearchaeia archaeon]